MATITKVIDDVVLSVLIYVSQKIVNYDDSNDVLEKDLE